MRVFAFDVVHRPGKLHQNADALSRHPRLSLGTWRNGDEEGDPFHRPPVLVPYPGVNWPLYAYSRAPAGESEQPRRQLRCTYPAVVSVCYLWPHTPGVRRVFAVCSVASTGLPLTARGLVPISR
ncbi:hypothetical protein PLESTB_001535700 [Pleodorina starrii]|uniref:Uncharacterized protein n=1 Tax=Pleodorina starrii TaxID=330485 RepID=A0A9W6F7X7_9CHLO|nr:hypothetical protein PLESTM_001841000 [Pleodorina starrii]GLC59787.1 hypothetical protein PLESTB_001535700 [Pleodorina starrii]GLC67329.1 hypothetical protein PLESTF_000543100 [Pleodorina starrii]